MKRKVFHRALSPLICLSFIAASQIFAVSASASPNDSYCDGNNTYQVLADNKSAKLTWNGFYNGEDITIPATITFPTNHETYNVTTIGDDMFDAHKIGKVTADHISTIETDAFKTSSISGIVLKSSGVTLGNYVFYGCQNLNTIDLSGVESMGTHVFQGTGLKSITIPSAITILPSCTFCDCSKLTTANLPDQMTAISDSAFEATAISSINLPSNLTQIGENAFKNSALQKITMPTSLKNGGVTLGDYVFYRCKNLDTIDLSGVKSIGSHAFQESGLENITIPSAITILPSCTFWGCSHLTTANLPDQMTEISDNAFNNSAISSIKLPLNLTKIGESAFQNSGLNKIDMPTSSSPLALAANAFYGCPLGNGIDLSHVASMGNSVFENSGIQSVTVPSAITVLPSCTFYGCSKLVTANLPDQMTAISDNAFNNSAISSINLPANLTQIGESAFQNSKLNNINMPTASKSLALATNAFYGCPLGNGIDLSRVTSMGNGVFENSGIQSVTVPSAITVLPSCTFIGCSKLTSLTLPDSMTEISDHSINSTGLSTIALPKSLTKIGENAFQGNSNLDKLVIPNQVNSIGDYAFYGCPSLKTITFESQNPPSFGTDVFGGSTNLKNVYVPKGTAQNYRSIIPSSININEKAVASISMKTKPNKLDYLSGQSLDLSGASIMVTYNDGTTADFSVTPDMVSGYDTGKSGSQTITVTYGGAQCTFEVNVTATKVLSNGTSAKTIPNNTSTKANGTASNPITGSENWPLIPLALLVGSAVFGVIIMMRRKSFKSKRHS